MLRFLYRAIWVHAMMWLAIEAASPNRPPGSDSRSLSLEEVKAALQKIFNFPPRISEHRRGMADSLHSHGPQFAPRLPAALRAEAAMWFCPRLHLPDEEMFLPLYRTGRIPGMPFGSQRPFSSPSEEARPAQRARALRQFLHGLEYGWAPVR